jgi:hypothetical protein
MSVFFTAEAEERRQKALVEQRAKKATTWELFKSTSIVESLQFAREHGWKNKKVQVRVVQIARDEQEFYVEPFEKDCSCPNILKYKDYFD